MKVHVLDRGQLAKVGLQLALSVAIAAAMGGAGAGFEVSGVDVAVPACRRCHWHCKVREVAVVVALFGGLAAGALAIPDKPGNFWGFFLPLLGGGLVGAAASFFAVSFLAAAPTARCASRRPPVRCADLGSGMHEFAFTSHEYARLFTQQNESEVASTESGAPGDVSDPADGAAHRAWRTLIDRLFFVVLPSIAAIVCGVLGSRLWGNLWAVLGGAGAGLVGGLLLVMLVLSFLLPKEGSSAPPPSNGALVSAAAFCAAVWVGLLFLPIGAREGPAGQAQAPGDTPGNEAPRPPGEHDAPATTSAPPLGRPLDAATALRDVRRGARERVETLKAWLAQGLHLGPGARRDMLRVIGPSTEREADDLLARSIGDPITTQEALECVPLAPPLTRRALLARLERLDPSFPPPEVARALHGVEDDVEAGIEATLIRIGHAREGGARRLVLARGVDWARSDAGQDLLQRLPSARQRDLLGAPEPQLRVLGVRLASAARAPDALEVVSPLLRDPSPIVREEVVEGLVALGDPRAAAPLARALTIEGDEGTRALMRRSLATLASDAAAVHELLALLAHADAGERLAGVAAIEVTEALAAIRPLVGALRDADRGVAVAAARVLTTLHGSRTRGVKDAVTAVIADVGRVAVETRDTELKRLTRKLYYDVKGRLPEQDLRR